MRFSENASGETFTDKLNQNGDIGEEIGPILESRSQLILVDVAAIVVDEELIEVAFRVANEQVDHEIVRELGEGLHRRTVVAGATAAEIVLQEVHEIALGHEILLVLEREQIERIAYLFDARSIRSQIVVDQTQLERHRLGIVLDHAVLVLLELEVGRL